MDDLLHKPSIILKIVVIAGVRPQFTKTAALQIAIRKYLEVWPNSIDTLYINTGQHYDSELAGAYIRDLNIHFDHTLVHKETEPLNILASMIIGVHRILSQLPQKPHWVIVNGDATSALAGAIAAVRSGIPVAHIEAGMRSGNLAEIEESNRRMIDHISSLHVCTSKAAIENLHKEGIVDSVFWSGDLTCEFIEEIGKSTPAGIADFPTGEYILATLHKADNVDSDETLRNFVYALSEHGRPVLFVTHPRTRKRLIQLGLMDVKGITFINSLPYHNMLSAIKGCAFIVTDSGGLHREAYYFRKRCLVRRDSGGWAPLMTNGIHLRIDRSRASITHGLRWIEEAIGRGEYENLQNEDLIQCGSNDALLKILIERALGTSG